MGRALGWLAALAALAAPAAYLALREPALEVTAAPVERGRVEQTVSAIASGTVRAASDAMIASELMGKVVAVPVEEGDRVRAGDLLVELQHDDLDAQVALAEANLEAGLALGNQAQIGADVYRDVSRTQVSQAEAQMRQAQADYKRLLALHAQHAISQSDLDKAALAARVAEEAYDAAVANQKQLEARREEVKSSRANVEQLRAALEVAKATRDKAFIRAPFDGIVSEVLIDEGEAVTPGVPLVQLVQEGERYVEAPFDEANAADIQLGQEARINLDAFRGVDFRGTVYYIAPVVSLNRDFTRTLNVKIRVEEGQDKFIPGMSADVIVLQQTKDDALFVPSEALVRQRYAYVIEGGRARRREVKTGIGNWSRMEVLDGLEEGETLITSVSLKELKDGVKVRVVDELDE
jgi:HlyD family secretion protein